jgi:predicted nucleotidyltransferase
MKQLQIDQIKEKVRPVLKHAGVTKSALFGSYVRGEATENSDVDILIDFPKEKSLFDFIGLKLHLEEALQLKVDLVEYNTIKPRLKQYILSEQVQIL